MAAVAPDTGVLSLETSPHPRKLRVGVFADGPLQPRWVAEALARIARSDFAEITLIETGLARPPVAPLAWRLYARWDRWAFGGESTDYVSLRAQVPHRSVGPDAADLDVAFALGAADDAVLADRARYGVWRFCFGADGTEPEPVAGLREVAVDEPLTGSGVKVALGAGTRLAYQSWARTYPFSVARNREQVLAKTAEFAYRSLRELHASGAAWLEGCRPAPRAGGQPASPGLLGLSNIGARLARRGVQKALNVEQWLLAYRLDARPANEAVTPDLAGFTRLLPPKDRDWADPFAIEKNGRYYVFFEELPHAEGKGHISMIEIDANGACSPPARVLEADYHLSYPFVFEHDGELFMVPESAKNRTVELYRCIDFPLAWRLERVLMSGVRLVDATFHHGPDRWWMFANSAAGDSRMFDDELHLFHAERLTGDWKPHARNPVKSDARCARPAGRLFTRDGALFRPAQVCAPRYGAGLSINRVLRLTPHEYAERQVERILPPAASGLYGLHTLNRAGALTVVDAFIRRRRF